VSFASLAAAAAGEVGAAGAADSFEIYVWSSQVPPPRRLAPPLGAAAWRAADAMLHLSLP
jgi:hypothetical protein